MPGGDYRDALRERAGWLPEAGPLLDADGERVGEHARDGRLHGRPASGPRRGPRRAALRQPDRPADQHDHARPARGPRDDHHRAGAGELRRRRCAGRPRDAVPCRDPDPPPRDADRGDRPARHADRAGARRPLAGRDRHAGLGRGARVRPRSCTTGTSCWAVAHRAAGAHRPRMPRDGRRRPA